MRNKLVIFKMISLCRQHQPEFVDTGTSDHSPGGPRPSCPVQVWQSQSHYVLQVM